MALNFLFSVVVVVHTPTVYQMSTTGVVQPANTTLLVCFLKYEYCWLKKSRFFSSISMTFNLSNCVPSLIYGGLVKRQIAIVCTFLLWYCHKEEKVTSITREANLKV